MDGDSGERLEAPAPEKSIRLNPEVVEIESGEVLRKLCLLLPKLDPSDLAGALNAIKTEAERRMGIAERQLKTAKALYATFDPIRGKQQTRTPGSVVNKPKRLKSTSGSTRQSNRSKRGDSTRLILAVLSKGPKSRVDLDSEFASKQHPATSLGTLLNRLKKQGRIRHDPESKMYSLPESAPADS